MWLAAYHFPQSTRIVYLEILNGITFDILPIFRTVLSGITGT